MCGIAIQFSPSAQATPLDLAAIRHRGPDSSGDWTSPDGHFWLGNTRLAIVDLSPTGAQPMTDPTNGNVIVINGEIYNHRAVREALGSSVAWQGTSDTETVLRAYGKWGPDFLARIKGMFAFAIFDAQKQALFVARDRLGIKPLYFTRDENGMRFASEVRLLEGRHSCRPHDAFEPDRRQECRPSAISAYLEWGACPEDRLLFSGVHAFPAGHAMSLGADGREELRSYWPAAPSFRSPKKDAASSVRRLLERAVEEHLLADVPVASFLSGGVDSSIVTALAAQHLADRLQTFSVGFDFAEFDESAIARDVAQRYQTDHHLIRLSDEEVIHSVREAVEKLDLPSADAINTYIVSRAVARQGVKVALSGLGGDELFGGYPSFRDVPWLKRFTRLPPALRHLIRRSTSLSERLADMPETLDAGVLARWRRRFVTNQTLRAVGLPENEVRFECPVDLPDDFARISWAELTGYMRRMLLRDADQMSMAVSLEMRVPFLDHELVEYVLGLPAAVKRAGPRPKSLLIESCRDLIPPAVYDRPKRGFVLPMKEWMRGPLAGFVDEGLRETITRELLPAKFVDGMRSAFANDRRHWTRLWSVVVLGHFAKRRQLYGTRHEATARHAHG